MAGATGLEPATDHSSGSRALGAQAKAGGVPPEVPPGLAAQPSFIIDSATSYSHPSPLRRPGRGARGLRVMRKLRGANPALAAIRTV